MTTQSRGVLRPIAAIIGVLAVVFFGLQFVRPELTNPPVTAELKAPPEVLAVLKNSCYNCH